MAEQPDRQPPTYPTEATAAVADPRLNVSASCYGRKHADCVVARGPVELMSGMNRGRWYGPWACSCSCHDEKGSN